MDRVTLTLDQSKAVHRAIQLGVVRHANEAVEMGLSVVRQLVQEHEGMLKIQAEAEAEEVARAQFSLF